MRSFLAMVALEDGTPWCLLHLRARSRGEALYGAGWRLLVDDARRCPHQLSIVVWEEDYEIPRP